MKRKFVCGIVICLALSVAGCGKNSEEQQAANYYQNELGLDKEEAEELAHELYGNDDEDTDIEEESGETVVEPLPELLESEWYEMKVQVYDMIFSNDMFMTAEDVRRIVEASEYEVEIVEGFDSDGNVVIDSIKMDGQSIVDFNVQTRGFASRGETNDMVAYGMLEEGEFYMVVFYAQDYGYDKESTEFADLATRDDVLAYLSANGIAEASEEQALYEDSASKYSGHFINMSAVSSFDCDNIYPGESDTTYAYVDHYTTHGAQSITLYRVHELGETDQVMEHEGYYHHETYDGAVLNVVNCVVFEFNADGTVSDEKWGIKKFIVMGEELE